MSLAIKRGSTETTDGHLKNPLKMSIDKFFENGDEHVSTSSRKHGRMQELVRRLLKNPTEK